MSDYQFEYEGYYIKPSPQHPKTYIVVTSGRGGKIPNILSGMFTSKQVAKDVIDIYLASQPKKEATDAEAKPKSRV